MDTFITQLTNKIMAERANQPQQQHQATHTAPPPPYSDPDTDADSDDEEDSDEEPMKLVINASNTIHGSNNVVPTSPAALADASKFSAILLQTIAQLNQAARAHDGSMRPLRVDLTVNCGVAVVGDRNVIGTFGLKPKAPPTLTPNSFGPDPQLAVAEAQVAAGAKRKAEDEAPEHEREAKRLAETIDGVNGQQQPGV
ncbi:hypothetical protein WHR41_05898 [Cladosporium halotolerans]|uniref:Uncharacterized protein n=1 Tax=Cladosporium halotolerans TaxID=1052096 RepID=A0AB34KK52_9PEZI